MKNSNKLAMTCLLAVSLMGSGCASMLPYNEEFTCPMNDEGQCISVNGAYRLALEGNQPKDPAPSENSGDSRSDVQNGAADNEIVAMENDIQRETLKMDMMSRYAAGMKTGAVLTPPLVMEVFIMPFQTTRGVLASERTLWIQVEDASWVWNQQGEPADSIRIGETQK